MKKTIVMLFTLLSTMVTFAEPGLVYAKFTGQPHDGTSVIMGSSGAQVVLSADMLYQASTSEERTTYAYAGYMWIEGGVTYTFRAAYDDFSSVKIDDVVVIGTGFGECQDNYADVKFCDSSWHYVEFRGANNGGAGGVNNGYVNNGGFFFRKNANGAWCRIADSGTGSLFRTDLPTGASIKGRLDKRYYGCNYFLDGSTFAVRGNATGIQDVEILSSVGGVSVTKIADAAFRWASIKRLVVPVSIELIENKSSGYGYSWQDGSAFGGESNIQSVIFLGAPPSGLEYSQLIDPPTGYHGSRIPNCTIMFRREYAADFLNKGALSFGGFVDGNKFVYVEVLSSSIRENDPTILDVVYKVVSSKPTVKVRVLAFEDGERSFAKVVRPETFVDGTEVNIGDNITPNVEHRLSWRVSSDWTTRLAKVKFEVLACEGDLLPLELMTIPASDQYGKMKISMNTMSEWQWFDALLWLYADHDSGLTLANGVLKNGATELASGTTVYAETATRQYISGQGYVYTYYHPAVEYVYSKMGYSLLSGTVLNYANQETRLGLSPSGSRQYAYKMVP